MPIEAQCSPLSIEVGLWGGSPRKTWAIAKSLNIDILTLVLHPNTSINIPTQPRNDIEYLHGLKDLRKLRGVQAVKVIWVLKAGGVRIYKSHWVNTKSYPQSIKHYSFALLPHDLHAPSQQYIPYTTIFRLSSISQLGIQLRHLRILQQNLAT